MKKTIALFSSLLLFAGIKAQTSTIKKETLKPASVQPGINADLSKAIKNVNTIKQTDKAIKFDKALKNDHIKKTNVDVPFKEAVAKPIKF